MDEEGLTLFLLPGMDGTGELFADFVKLLPDWIEPRVVSYPRDRRLSYDQLLPILKSALPTGEPYAILAESFAMPLAVKCAAAAPSGCEPWSPLSATPFAVLKSRAVIIRPRAIPWHHRKVEEMQERNAERS